MHYWWINWSNIVIKSSIKRQEAFEKCWAHSPLEPPHAACFTLPFTRCRYCRTPPAHRCPKQHQRQQRQRVTEGTAMALWTRSNYCCCGCCCTGSVSARHRSAVVIHTTKPIVSHCKNMSISTDILWRVFHILTDPFQYTYVCIRKSTE